MKIVGGGRAYRWLAAAAGTAALAFLAWWLVADGSRGAEIAGDLAAAAGFVAAGAALWPLLPRAQESKKTAQAAVNLLEKRGDVGLRGRVIGKRTGNPIEPGKANPLCLSGRIGLWGPKESGKTCFLAALNVAVAQASPPWTLVGEDSRMTDDLSLMTSFMVRNRRFPPQTDGIGRFRGVMTTELEIIKWQGLGKKRKLLPVQFNLSVLDAGGEYFNDYHMGDMRWYPGSDSHELVDELVGCDGIVLFFDITTEREAYADEVGAAYETFHNGAARLEHELRMNGGLDGSRLPHRVAVCISKYDEPEVLDSARSGGHLVVRPDDPYSFPRVADERAEMFFEELCRKSPNGNAALLNHAIKRYFHADRVRYFAVSSIGFYTDSMIRFNAADCYNLEYTDRIEPRRLRGDIHPINVLEPLLWLGVRKR